MKIRLLKVLMTVMALLILFTGYSFGEQSDRGLETRATAMAAGENKPKPEPEPAASPNAQPTASPNAQPAASPSVQPTTSPATGPRTVRFRFLVVPGHTRALVDYVKVVDKAGKVIASVDIGSKDDYKAENRVPVNNENQWGEAKAEESCTYRPVNEGNKLSQHSEFILMLDRLPKESPLRIIIRYKDSGDDLFPVEIFDGTEFRRIGQILLEDSGQWLEEEFKIPPVDIK
ncbi:MAG: PT domain-containing protein [Vulcanimicrobiota bacterium]